MKLAINQVIHDWNRRNQYIICNHKIAHELLLVPNSFPSRAVYRKTISDSSQNRTQSKIRKYAKIKKTLSETQYISIMWPMFRKYEVLLLA